MSVLLPVVGIDAEELEHMGFRKEAEGSSGSAADRPSVVAIDLDGTIAKHFETYDATSIPDPRPGARKTIQKWKDAGHTIIIWTCRGDKELVSKWLKKHKIPFDHINNNPDQPEDGSQKIVADVYVDDRAVDGTAAWDKLDSQVSPRLEKEASSYFLKAFRQIRPMYDRRISILKNIQNYLMSVYHQGRRNISQAYSDDATIMTYKPEAARWQRLTQYLDGQDPVITHPVDRFMRNL